MSTLDLTTCTRDEWLAARKLGASDAAAIFGIHLFRTRFDVWAEKVGLKEPFAGNEATRLGLKLEPVIAGEYAERTGAVIQKCQEMRAHPEYPFITATPDYELPDPAGLEIKTTGHRQAAKWEDGETPNDAHLQAQQQLLVFNAWGFVDIAALIGGNRLEIRRVEPDERIQARLIEGLSEFWQLVLTRTPPPLVAEDVATVNALYPGSIPGLEIDLPAEAEAWLEARARASEAEKLAKSQKDEAEANIKRLMGNAERARIGKSQILWKTIERKAYTVAASSYRKFTIMGGKNGQE